MKERSLHLQGYSFGQEVWIQHFDMSLISRRKEANQKWLLFFSAETNTATIDFTTPDWYARLAILAEAIANNKVYRKDINLFDKNLDPLRIIAEKYVLTKVGIHRKDWLKARKYYYDVLIEKETDEKRKALFESTRAIIETYLELENESIVEYLKCSEGFFETRYLLTDFSSTTNDPRHKWLVYFTSDNRVFLDETSPKWYRKLASLSEEMAMATKYPRLLKDYDYPGSDYHDALIETIIIDKFTSGQTRKKYIEARIELFQLLLDTELNTSRGVKNALEYLEDRQKKNQ